MIARFHGDGGELIPKGTLAARRAIAALRRGTHLTQPRPARDVAPVPSSQSTHRWSKGDSNSRSHPLFEMREASLYFDPHELS
jgi:hypothetical protein